MKKLFATSFAALLITSLYTSDVNAYTEKQAKVESNQAVQVYSNTINQEQFNNLVIDLQSNRDILALIERIQAKYPNVIIERVKKQPLYENEQRTVNQEESVQERSKADQEQQVAEQPEQPEQPVIKTPTTQQPNQPEQSSQEIEQVQTGITAEEQKMVDLVNEERAKVGLPALKVSVELTKVARIKAQDMIDHNYFSHQSPTYGSPFDMLQNFGVSYRIAGENLAGNQTVEGAHQALMNSNGHRANILNQQYSEVGIGIIDGGSYGKMFVQLFKG
ncbi:CAP domain-containing protein [Alkalihalobacillus sp. BA299]|uniref:CAP domain-containing protein n=1 Tax=Alkalihalobacillus sp. BA299 TaxID=2815938 RepID=UPI001ADC5057|nr:CAP domain-containing protein [Alkalihalobacillus sp. BA299]